MRYDLSKKTDEQLIRILEHPENYVATLVSAARLELPFRALPEEQKLTLATDLYRQKLKKLFDQHSLSVDRFELPYSSILSEQQKTELFEEEFTEYQQRRNLFNTNLNRYIG